jgi:hypothetical protein
VIKNIYHPILWVIHQDGFIILRQLSGGFDLLFLFMAIFGGFLLVALPHIIILGFLLASLIELRTGFFAKKNKVENWIIFIVSAC